MSVAARQLDPDDVLGGDRAGIGALTITRNWRMTFGLTDDQAIIDLDLEDYH